MTTSHVTSSDVSDVTVVARALADPTRQRVLDALAGSAMRTGELAAAAGVSVSSLSRHLAVLRDANLVERTDVEHDARGRTYRLRDGAMDHLARWVDHTRWAAQLAANAPGSESGELLGRTGAFLDAFGDRDVAFFERHVADDAVVVFPGMPGPLGKHDVLAAVVDHPRWERHDVEGVPVVRHLAGHRLECHIASVRHEDDVAPRRVVITTLFAERDPWQVAHLQWTSAPPPTRARDDETT
jgi:DNA-binding transcriptional ArsR family regulator